MSTSRTSSDCVDVRQHAGDPRTRAHGVRVDRKVVEEKWEPSPIRDTVRHIHGRGYQFVISCGNDQLFATLCSRPDLVFNRRFRPNFDRMTSNIVLTRELKATLKKQPAAHWRKIVHEAGVPVGPRLNVAEAAEHPRSRPAICRSRLAVSA
jgi:crotonobetainyl-CoA:carnitine CoA-transferase CaiB-like acyl-CoA transferase